MHSACLFALVLFSWLFLPHTANGQLVSDMAADAQVRHHYHYNQDAHSMVRLSVRALVNHSPESRGHLCLMYDHHVCVFVCVPVCEQLQSPTSTVQSPTSAVTSPSDFLPRARPSWQQINPEYRTNWVKFMCVFIMCESSNAYHPLDSRGC